MVKPSIVQEPTELLAFMLATWPEMKRTRLKQWLKHEAVTVNDRPITQFNHLLVPGDKVAIRGGGKAPEKATLPAGIKLLHEDDAILVIDKPSGLLSIASQAEDEKTAYFLVTAYLRNRLRRQSERVWIVHRLDRETSGLMVLAKTLEAKTFLQSHWEEAEKIYDAIVEGRLKSERGTYESDLDETNPYRVRSVPASDITRHAVTHYEVIARSQWRTHVQVRLETGRRHQIRVHFSEAGHPIVGDKKYGAVSDPARRLSLHARSLKIPHPTSGKMLEFTSPLPKRLADLVVPPASRRRVS